SVAVDHGTLSLGRIPNAADTVTRTLTYTNPSDRAVTLRLSTDVRGTGSDPKQRPELELSERVLVVPAGGSASVDVRLSPQQTDVGGYAGTVVATNVRRGSDPVRTAISFAVDGPLHTVTVNAVDRDGQPAEGHVDLWSAETGQWDRIFMPAGTVSAQVPEGLYTVITSIGGWQASRHTVAGDPELEVDEDVTLTYDARDAEPAQIATPQDADLDSFDVIWYRKVGNRSFAIQAVQGIHGEDFSLIPSPKAKTGTFELTQNWQLAQPLLTADLSGPDGFRLASPQLASAPMAYVGETSLPVVDAGAGTPEELAAADVDGKIAFVTRRTWGELSQQAAEAKAAGATMLLAHDSDPDMGNESVWPPVLPTYRIGQEAGERVRQALQDDADRTLDLVGLKDATYSYQLSFTESGRIPAGQTTDVDDVPMAAVLADYRQNSERMLRHESWIPYAGTSGFANSLHIDRNGPLVRTEYVTTEDVEWQRFAQPHMFLGLYWTSTIPEVYEAGETYHQLWWGPLVHPAVPPIPGAEEIGMPVARFRDAIRIFMPHYSYGGTLRGTIFEQMGDRSELTLRREGEVVGKSTWPEVQYSVPADEAEYELSLDVTNGPGNWSDLSVHTESTWRFRSGRSDEERTVLPLVQLEYDIEAGSKNEVAAGSAYPLFITPGYQPEATGPEGFSATVDVSYDDGETWTTAAVDQVDGRFRATVPAATAPGFATVRVVVTDADGNRLTQRIDRAWRIAE
ncbi:MAG: hypothetical protein GEU96_10935, partial [Propionibacteriales bacterium]|nr:hypothetical protein [Propionibacteriales bacterium]